ncbi:MAG: hypothetical protein ACREYE_12770 [Gammaproteobacteria bacterium]
MKRPKRTAVHRHARAGLALFDLARTAGEMAAAAPRRSMIALNGCPGRA